MTDRRRLLRAGGLGLGATLILATALATTVAPAPADAFCGFYVAGADASLYNDATMVVLMRNGTRTVLSMQNDYQGPVEDFALVVPVPVVLQEGDVKTLPKEVFEHIDQLAAPRLVEYWEEDPCWRPPPRRGGDKDDRRDEMSAQAAGPDDMGVTVEAEFTVGEYDVVILSAEDASGLDDWLRTNEYNIPEGAQPVLEPYIEGGMKFFVAKVDATKVEFVDGPNGKRAMLSPLRFGYESEDFALPIRLGLINAQGPQDLLVHILATERYQAANYDNVTIPTNLVVKDNVRENFGAFYVSLFDRTLAQNPKAVVTEYAWSASSCDPCPTPPLEFEELVLLGANEMPRWADGFDDQGELKAGKEEYRWQVGGEFVLTRLHARYDASSLGEDLVFEEAKGLTGGRGMPRDGGKLDPVVREQEGRSDFQARYAILHFWDKPFACNDPTWDRWGGPPNGGGGDTAVARDLAFVAREDRLEGFLTRAAHAALALDSEPPPDAAATRKDDRAQAAKKNTKTGNQLAGYDDGSDGKKGCACATTDSDNAPWGWLGLAGLASFARRRRS